ncbi:MAG: aminoacyl-histidine dipeptidase [Bacteroidota bacterium]|jgi:dipeptidase D|nr:aminoacyl-histidine dipeptidase [Bacteroidota bacterium]
MAVNELEPKILWKHFHGLTQVPRPSKKEEKILAYLKQLLTELGHAYEQDETGNLVVRKPATPGYENAPTVLIQGHVDMVCEKNKDTQFDFDNDPIVAYVDGEWVTAKGTTLGADNGIGVAAGLAVLESKDLVHPPMEFLFTVDEETGLTGAKGLKPGFLKSEIMLNLDSEEDGALYVGCSGGMDTAGVMTMATAPAPATHEAVEIMVSGLKGGHSGLDIHTGRGNAIKFLVRVLTALRKDIPGIAFSTMLGGSKRNAIPREAEVIVYVPKSDTDAIIAKMAGFAETFRNEIHTVEPDLNVIARRVDGNGQVMQDAQFTTLLDVLQALPHGVLKMSADIDGLVETSTNLATVTIDGGKLVVGTSQRSSVESEKFDAVAMVEAVLRLAGLEIVMGDGYPGWKPNMESRALKFVRQSHQELFGKDPEIKAIHAGLECGLIGEVYPKMDMISFGPTIQGAHSPDERLNIPTTGKFWQLVVRTLENIAKAG